MQLDSLLPSEALLQELAAASGPVELTLSTKRAVGSAPQQLQAIQDLAWGEPGCPYPTLQVSGQADRWAGR